MSRTDPQPGSPDIVIRRRDRLVSLGIVIFTIIVLTYAFNQLRKQTTTTSSGSGPLQVRTDLMRGQACHVDNEVIMGDCTAEDIETLQRQARRSSSL